MVSIEASVGGRKRFGVVAREDLGCCDTENQNPSENPGKQSHNKP